MPRFAVRTVNSSDSNFRPWLVVTTSGTPKRDIHCVVSVTTTVYADMLSIGHASSQRVKLSTHVTKYLQMLDGDSGPTRSTCMCPKRRYRRNSVFKYLCALTLNTTFSPVFYLLVHPRPTVSRPGVATSVRLFGQSNKRPCIFRRDVNVDGAFGGVSWFDFERTLSGT